MGTARRGYSAYGTTVVGTDVTGVIKVAEFFGEIVKYGDFTQKRGKIDKTNSSSGGFAEFLPEDILEGEEYELEILHNATKEPPFGDTETIKITLPLRGTYTTPATIEFDGFLISNGISFPVNEGKSMLTKCKLAVTGEVTYTAPSGGA